jgi:hypothetical protein
MCMLKLHLLTLISLLLLIIGVGCSSSDQSAMDKTVRATLEVDQPVIATPTAIPTPTETPVLEPTAVPTPTPKPIATSVPTFRSKPDPIEPIATNVPTPEPTATSVPTLELTATNVPTPEPTAKPTENEIVTVTTSTNLIGIEGSEIILEGVQAKTLSDVGVLEAWARWIADEEIQQISINQETGSVSGSHVYSQAGEYTARVWVHGETGDKGWMDIVVEVLPKIPSSNVLTTIDSTGDVGLFASSAIGADGLGLISYYEGGLLYATPDTAMPDSGLKVLHCHNTFCSP